MWVTIASVVVYLAYNTAGMYVTEELGAVTRTVGCVSPVDRDVVVSATSSRAHCHAKSQWSWAVVTRAVRFR